MTNGDALAELILLRDKLQKYEKALQSIATIPFAKGEEPAVLDFCQRIARGTLVSAAPSAPSDGEAATAALAEYEAHGGVTLEDLKAEIARAAIDGQPAPSGWRPIETAPKDGTRIILFTTTSGDAELTQYLRDVGDECETLEAVQIGSFNEVSGEWDLQHFIGNPTHWLPLPPAPGKDGRT